MPDYAFDVTSSGLVTAFGPAALGMAGIDAPPVSSPAAWPSANYAVLIPFVLPEANVVTQISHYNGATVSGNVDVGVYDELGNRKVSKGSVAQAGVSTLQVHDVTDTPLSPGCYFMAMAMDNNVGTLVRATASAQSLRTHGVRGATTSFVLPNPITLINATQTTLPLMAVHFAAGAV